MRQAHIGIPICTQSDIEGFYIDLLGMSLQYQFEVDRDFTHLIFGISRTVPVYMLGKDDLLLELFCVENVSANPFHHVAIWVDDRAELIQRVRQKGYRIDIIPRVENELIFIFDHSGNRFEIKQSAQ
ncbi:MAG: VOC family protein [Deltaproteobacteria bacterium]|nr:VOC family protein [Deltaproteobacteria bacterium]